MMLFLFRIREDGQPVTLSQGHACAPQLRLFFVLFDFSHRLSPFTEYQPPETHKFDRILKPTVGKTGTHGPPLPKRNITSQSSVYSVALFTFVPRSCVKLFLHSDRSVSSRTRTQDLSATNLRFYRSCRRRALDYQLYLIYPTVFWRGLQSDHIMSEEGKKFSFSFAKSIKKPVLQNVPAAEAKKVEYIECLDNKAIKIIGYVLILEFFKS